MYGPRMRGVGWTVKDHTVRAGYWEMFDDGCWKSLMLIYNVITKCRVLMKDYNKFTTI